MGPPGHAQASGMGPPGMAIPMPAGGSPETEQVRPLAAPPYLASQTAARADAPVEPWADSLKLICLIFGVLILAAFAAPWGVGGDKTIFSWSGFGDMPAKIKIQRLLLVGSGAVAIVVGLIPLSTLGRGIAAALAGLSPLLYALVTGKVQWTTLVVFAGAALLVAGLLVRSQYKSAVLGRLLVTIGAACVLATFLIPQHGQVPLVAEFRAIGDLPGKAKLTSIVKLLPFLLAVVSLVAWLPAPSSAAGSILAWMWITLPVVVAIQTLVISPQIAAALKGGLSQFIWLPFAAMGWNALAGYGLATMLGKGLEHN